jgi:outer membrane protein assembly factor BamB
MTRQVLVTALLLALGSRAAAEPVLYVADHEVKKVLKIKFDGTLLWDYPNDNGHDVQVLPNRNVLLNRAKVVQEVTPDKKVVWEYRGVSPEAVQRLANGNTLVADNGRMNVVEVDREGRVLWEYKVANNNKRPTPTMRMVRRLDNGNTLICASTEDAVLEIDRSGKIVWKYDVPFPYLATRLPGGNTLISSGSGYGSPVGHFVIEVDKDGKTVWKYGGADAPEDQKLNWPSGHVRLPNGNTLIAVSRDGVIREVTPEKKTVRTIRSPAMKHPATIVVVDE